MTYEVVYYISMLTQSCLFYGTLLKIFISIFLKIFIFPELRIQIKHGILQF